MVMKSSHPKCSASITISHNGQVTNVSKESHKIVSPGNSVDPKDVHEPMSELEVMIIIKFLKRIKERCTNEDTGPNKVFEEELNEFFKNLKTEDEKKIVASLVPRYDDIKYGLHKRRSKTRPNLPDSLRTTIIDGIYTKTTNKIDQFLIFKSKNNKKLVFCSKTGLEILSKSSE
ncbi:unnamed protein product [Brachionus calyciflorus]|uniref:Uncharacterized protein n=1 Tax=Brachionus calyciflorus TaxID=104777 RepID=A0A813P5G8_9BILA|nr:unnamed protein product [Brachionus calyciflorus]